MNKSDIIKKDGMYMLDIKNVTIINKKDNRAIIKNFNFTLNQGDKAVIIGEEGNGKSTLMKFIYDRNRIEDYCECSGQVIGNVRLGLLDQEMDSSLYNMSVKDYLSEVDIYNSTYSIWDMNLDAELLYSDRKLGVLSGGEKVKIRLIKLLANEPDIILLDEPTNDLDIETLEWLENFINNSRKPILYVSHDETLIENTANVIIHLEQIKRKTEPRYNIEYMGYKEYITKRLHGIKKQETIARKQREDYKKQMDRWQQIYNKVDHQQDTISRQDPGGARLLKKKMKNLKSMEKRIERNTEEFLEIPDVEEAILYSFPEGVEIARGKKVIEYSLEQLKIISSSEEKVLARDLFLRVTGREHVAIIGNNGIGKTTFLRKVAEELINRRDINVGYMSQNYEEILNYEMLPTDFLVSNGQKEDITKAFTYMGGMKFTRDEMEHKIGNLSGGQKAKLILLRMILDGCNVLVLDEPTRNLSPLSGPVIREVLSDYKGAIISVTHDRKYIEEVCDTLYELTKDGLRKIDSITQI